MDDEAEVAARRYEALRPWLDESQRRLLVGFETERLSRGVVASSSHATVVAKATVMRAAKDLAGAPTGRGGRRADATSQRPGTILDWSVR
jgi:hypothetical protein